MTTVALPEPPFSSRRPTGEAALRERLQLGDEEALAGLVDRHYVGLTRVALLYLGQRGDAYEAVQRLLRRLPRLTTALDRETSLERGLYGLLLRELRETALAGGAVAASALDRRAGGGEEARHAGGRMEVLEERVEPGELEELVREVLAALPLDQREVAILRDVERWSADEVERLLGHRPAEQRRLLGRARSCIRRVLEAYAEAAAEPRPA